MPESARKSNGDVAVKQPTPLRQRLALALYGIERRNRPDAFKRDPAPIYLDLANNLADSRENRAALIALLAELENSEDR